MKCKTGPTSFTVFQVGNFQSLERNKSGGVCGSNTGPSVLHRLVGDGELAQVVTNHLRLISTWLKVLPLYTPTIDPVISGTIIMFLRRVLTTSGFSLGGASFFFLRSFLIKAMGLRLRPRENFRLIRQGNNSMSCSLFISRS